jgi:alanine racemase
MVIKGNAYGHGIKDLVPVIEECGVDYFAVFSAEEAEQALSVKNKSCDMMIMGFLDVEHIPWAIKNEISFYVFTLSRLNESIKAAKKCKKKAKIHIEVETGMNRTGFRKGELQEVFDLVKQNKEHLQIEGLCTHLAGAESITNFYRIKRQVSTYRQLVKQFEEADVNAKYKHIACSAGVLNYPETHLDLVRVGIANYGYWPSNELRMNKLLQKDSFVDPLKAVLSWKSKVMSINVVPEGEYISYGKSYLTNRESKVASVPVGYGYGFSRDLSNLGRVLINEKRVSVVGVVNMNMMLVDVTDLPDVKEEDEVVLIGKQGQLEITVSSFSDMNNSLNYELLTRLPHDIPRFIINK